MVLLKRLGLAFLALAVLLTGCNLALPGPKNPPATSTSSVTQTDPVSALLTSLPSTTPLPTPTALAPTPTPPPASGIAAAEQDLINGSLDQAAQLFQQEIQHADPATEPQALYGLARAQFLQGNCTDAQATANRLVQQYASSGFSSGAHYLLAQCLEQHKAYSEAAGEYRLAMQVRPGVLDAFFQQHAGDALTQAGDLAGALSAYQSAAQATALPDPTMGIQFKIGQTQLALGKYSDALDSFSKIYAQTDNIYAKSSADVLAAQTYLLLGQNDQAYTHYQDAIDRFPTTYDAYRALVALVDAGQPVNELTRGIVDYNAGQYGAALVAFQRYLAQTPNPDGTVFYYQGLANLALALPKDAIASFQQIVALGPKDSYYAKAWEETAVAQWAHLGDYTAGAQTLLDFVASAHDDPDAPGDLLEAGRIYARGGLTQQAVSTWLGIIEQYPASQEAYQGLNLAGLAQFGAGQYDQAQVTFQRALALATATADQAKAYFWLGKARQALGQSNQAAAAWQQTVLRDPYHYYGIRAAELIKGEKPFQASPSISLGLDLNHYRPPAEDWLRTTFSLPANANFDDWSGLRADSRWQRGDALWQLGEYALAQNEFDAMRRDLKSDAANLYRLMLYFLSIQDHRMAVLCSVQIQQMAGGTDPLTLEAPALFNYVAFGPYYRELMLPLAQADKVDPLLLFAMMRQESLFDASIGSSAGAMGLLQLMPATAQEVSGQMGWPANFSADQLVQPVVNLRLGIRYLSNQLGYFDGNVPLALAAYNAGPGNASQWSTKANGDPDLFYELMPYDETRSYLSSILENYDAYVRLYSLPG